MALARKVIEITGKAGTVKVVYRADWQEYRVVPVSNNKAWSEARTYHTDDKADAISTAELMASAGMLAGMAIRAFADRSEK